MRHVLRAMRVILRWLFGIVLVAIGILAVLILIGYMNRFTDSVTLPNGMILKREFDFSKRERHDMFASDGRRVLSRDIEGVCFNDRYVRVITYTRGQGGLFDRMTDSRVPADDRDAYQAIVQASGLEGGHGCNGYYIGMVGPGLLYGGPEPFLPSCDGRNLSNQSLADRSWFDRPCSSSSRGNGRSMPLAKGVR